MLAAGCTCARSCPDCCAVADHHSPGSQQALFYCVQFFFLFYKCSVLCLLQRCHPGPRTLNAFLARYPCALVPETSRMTQTTMMMVGCCTWASLQLHDIDSHPGSWPCRLVNGCLLGAGCLQIAAFSKLLVRALTPPRQPSDSFHWVDSHQHTALKPLNHRAFPCPVRTTAAVVRAFGSLWRHGRCCSASWQWVA